MRKQLETLRSRTMYMSVREKVTYILTYYWYHILGLVLLVCTPFFLAAHVADAMERTEFTCVLVNQAIDYDRDDVLAAQFAAVLGVKESLIVIDSDYNISYGDVQLEGINESSYEKFFIKWGNKELDAVILPVSFYEYCKEMGGTYRDLGEFETGSLPLYEDEGVATGILIEQTGLQKYITNETGEELLLVFPESGERKGACQSFLEFVEGLGG